MHDDKPPLDEVETLDVDRWFVGNEALYLRPRPFEGYLEAVLVDTNRLAPIVVNGPAFAWTISGQIQ
jgi:hypothetical protein